MGKKYRFFHRARVRAPVVVAWDTFTDHERLPEFTNTPCRILTPGSPDRNGLGCVRRIGALGWEIDEIVNIWRVNEVWGYHIVASDWIEAHQGVVRFFPTSDGGCEWVYDMQNIPTQFALDQAATMGIGYREMLAGEFAIWMSDLEAECERRADGERVRSAPHLTSEEALYLD